jgi:hypothetical protein
MRPLGKCLWLCLQVQVYDWNSTASHHKELWLRIKDLGSHVWRRGPRQWKAILKTGPTDLRFPAGTMTLLNGPPSSGTSTFLKALAGVPCVLVQHME